MNNIRVVHPVHMSDAHMGRLGRVMREYGKEYDASTSPHILSLTRWEWGVKPDNVTVCSLLDILKIEGVQDRIPYPDGAFNLCICIDILDRLVNPSSIIGEILRVLSPAGTVYVEVPYMQPYDHTRGGYWRFTPEGLKLLFKDFSLEEFGIANGPGSTMHWISRIYHALQFDREGNLEDLFCKAGDANYCEAYSVFGMDGEHLKTTDEELNSKEHAVCIAASYYMISKKKGSVEHREGEKGTVTTNTPTGDDVAQLRVSTDTDAKEVRR